jgi:hypothetical protein
MNRERKFNMKPKMLFLSGFRPNNQNQMTNTLNSSCVLLLLLLSHVGRADGLDIWTKRYSTNPFSVSPSDNLSGIVYGNGQFVAVGWHYDTNWNATGLIVTSPDGVNWFRRLSVAQSLGFESFFCNAVAYGNGQFVA